MADNQSLQVPQRGAGVQIPQSNTGIQVPTDGGLTVPSSGGGGFRVPTIDGAGLKIPAMGGLQAPSSGFKVPTFGQGTAAGLQVPQAQFPAANSQQRASSQSLLKPRQKVALKKGRSLMDWVRLGNQKGKVLNGIGGRSCDVTVEELAKHNKLNDAWMSIRGKVYNVTPYMEYHPGGEEELMKGVGADGTQLFNEVHQWVNVEGFLEKCYIGRLKRTIDLTGATKKPPPSLVSPSLSPPERHTILKPKARYDWYQNDTEITITIYAKCNTMAKDKVIIDKDDKNLRVTVFMDDYVYTIHLELNEDISNKHQVRVRTGAINRILITLVKTEPKSKWPSLGRPLEDNNSVVLNKEREPRFRSCKLISSSPITHDALLYTFQLPTTTSMSIPVGYHVYLKMNCNGEDVTRPYTVVQPSLIASDSPDVELDNAHIHLMIKIYSDGVLTPQISHLKEGDSISISDYEGSFDVSRLSRCNHLIMLAAGTGFTPMVRLLHHCLNEGKETKCKLLFFNKTEKDIFCRDELQKLATQHTDRFDVVHILSAADGTSWSGPHGRVRKELIEEHVPSLKEDQKPLVCICGPTAFTSEAFRLIKDHGYTPNTIHLFTA